ncbi:hypothetical protein TNCV_1845391 [Trichonephila clavipes]|nr:hypothetical protein TNCV_1845391 [Trichonephila clavipes]
MADTVVATALIENDSSLRLTQLTLSRNARAIDDGSHNFEPRSNDGSPYIHTMQRGFSAPNRFNPHQLFYKVPGFELTTSRGRFRDLKTRLVSSRKTRRNIKNFFSSMGLHFSNLAFAETAGLQI